VVGVNLHAIKHIAAFELGIEFTARDDGRLVELATPDDGADLVEAPKPLGRRCRGETEGQTPILEAGALDPARRVIGFAEDPLVPEEQLTCPRKTQPVKAGVLS
jgi:hypothetical protein